MKKYWCGIRSKKSIVPLDCKFHVLGENENEYHFHSEMGRFDFWVNKSYLRYCTEEHKSLDSKKLNHFLEDGKPEN